MEQVQCTSLEAKKASSAESEQMRMGENDHGV